MVKVPDPQAPHTWGIPGFFLLLTACMGNTPTCVGNIRGPRCGCGPCQVHPHMRGEYRYASRYLDRSSGSPSQVHPHVSWEHLGANQNLPSGQLLAGLPPRVWRIRFPSCLSPRLEGSPPRVWGISFEKLLAEADEGSPPRELGTLRRQPKLAFWATFGWLAPTCVGNIPLPPGPRPSSKDHPHVRGEYQGFISGILGLIGSPPRAWGISGDARRCNLYRGITPTCVGNIL